MKFSAYIEYNMQRIFMYFYFDYIIYSQMIHVDMLLRIFQ